MDTEYTNDISEIETNKKRRRISRNEGLFEHSKEMPIIAHGSEMVLNPLQQKSLWNMIASGQGTSVSTQNSGDSEKQQSVIVNNITPVFQSLDPAQGQMMFQDWMKQSGIPIVKDSIKNNNHQMRDLIKGV